MQAMSNSIHADGQIAAPSGIGLFDAGKNSLQVFAVMDTAKGKNLSAGILERGSAIEELIGVENKKAVVEDPGILYG